MTEILNYPKCYKHTLTGHGEYTGSYRHLSQQQQELQLRMFNGMQYIYISSYLQTKNQQNQIKIIFCLMFITNHHSPCIMFFQVHNLGRVLYAI